MKPIAILVALLVAVPLTAQKKEIKKAQQEIKAGNFERASSLLDQAKRIFAVADDKTRAEYYITEAELFLAEKPLDVQQTERIAKSLKVAKGYELSAPLQQRIALINSKINGFSATIAQQEFSKKNYTKAALYFKNAFQIEKDTTLLLKAARSHLLAKEYEETFMAYTQLLNFGYTNAKPQYVATHKKTLKKDAFASRAERNEAIAAGLYKNPEVITSNSKLPELLRGITVAAIELNKRAAAIAIIDRTLAKMPENKIMRNQLSQLYRKLDANDKYYAIIDRLIKEDPNNTSLYYNAALSSTQNKDLDRAINYYKKVLIIEPDYLNATINLCGLLYEQDKNISSKMNALGDTEADDKQYQALQLERNQLYDELIPYVEVVVKAQPTNQEYSKKLKNLYRFKGVIAIEGEED